MSNDERIAAVVARLNRAREDLQEAMKARDELLVELTGSDAAVSMELAQDLGLTGREAASIVRKASGAKPWLPPGARC